MAHTDPPAARRTNWTFLTNHARVLAAIARDPGSRLRDIAAVCRLTERAVQAVVGDLERDGYLTHTRDGRRNRYRIAPHTHLRHPAEDALPVEALLTLLTDPTITLDADTDLTDTERLDLQAIDRQAGPGPRSQARTDGAAAP
ncbi:helix-turn-helix transcriptional regulator [Kitasatospora sp. NPDC054939]